MKAEEVKRASYTLESKLEAVRLVQGGQSCAAIAKVLGMPSQTLENWVRQAAKGELAGAGAKPVSAEQMELTRLKAELAKVKMERDILKKSDGVLCAGISVKYAWIERHKSCCPVIRQCEVLNVSTSGYFGHQRRRIADDPAIPGKRMSDAALLIHIKAVHAESQRRIWLAKGLARTSGK
jgi:transposase-like protein